MQNFVLFLCLITSSYAFAANYQVVSDFDDTVKITNVPSTKKAICNTLLSTKVFTAVPTLYRSFEARGAPISIVSGGVIHLKALMYDDLIVNGVPYNDIYLRHYFSEGTLEYKYSRLVTLMNKHRRPMVLIGDDTQLDPDAYNRFREQYPSQVLAIYIRKVTGRPLPRQMRSFYTAFDVAAYEYMDGRLKFEDVQAVADEVLAQTELSHLLPAHVKCPQNTDDYISLLHSSYSKSKLFRLTLDVTDHVINLCKQRSPVAEPATAGALENIPQTN